MRRSLLTFSILAVVVAAAPACATKGFVRTQVGEVNTKVDTLGTTVEETQKRTTERIGQVDAKAEAAGKSAADARSAADKAATAATAANTAAKEAATRVTAVETAAKRIVYEVTLSEDQGQFKFGKTDLPDTAKGRLDEVINKLKAEPSGAYIEIEGHTDNVGSKMVNEKLGLDRAEAVKRYIYETHQIPLHKINIISYGEDKPVAPNNTRDGRAQNRRVVIRVLS